MLVIISTSLDKSFLLIKNSTVLIIKTLESVQYELAHDLQMNIFVVSKKVCEHFLGNLMYQDDVIEVYFLELIYFINQDL
jgi:hypothetical protein